ncbi:nuclear transport factor 2 family protein [Streptomyces sp. WAC 01325]|uniref:nuclear transport factor 2 family protein n=1 Tax=Streptomyces sp. WAC 01325 TaxID=2203202 RepID=UPI000F891FC9|nr:nuclear transport factor 2 family protein [Streptomyces sp. WAC 01325]RSN01272.1 nuclear transport factor 2 family protein [Streptomyces sp. WAC 01325]
MTDHVAGLPECVTTYLTAPFAELAERADEVFAADAVVRDEGGTYQGLASVHGWAANLAVHFTMNCTVRSVVTGPGIVLANVTYDGNFPGSPVDRYLHFSVAEGRITALTSSN